MSTYAMTPPDTISVYYFCSFDVFLKIMCYGDMKLTVPSATNDLFEFGPSIDYLKEQEKARRSKGLTGDLLKGIKENYAFVSFCSSMNSPTMWGYYADSHKGVCLEFRFPLVSIVSVPLEYGPPKKRCIYHLGISHPSSIFSEGGLKLLDVEYRDERFCMKDNDYMVSCVKNGQAFCGEGGLPHAVKLRILLIKSTGWQEEREKRLLFNIENKSAIEREGKLFIQGLNKYIKAVYIGAGNMHSVSDVNNIVARLKHDESDGIEVFKVKEHSDLFIVDIE